MNRHPEEEKESIALTIAEMRQTKSISASYTLENGKKNATFAGKHFRNTKLGFALTYVLKNTTILKTALFKTMENSQKYARYVVKSSKHGKVQKSLVLMNVAENEIIEENELSMTERNTSKSIRTPKAWKKYASKRKPMRK